MIIYNCMCLLEGHYMIFMKNFTIFYEISYKCPNVRQTFSIKTQFPSGMLFVREKNPLSHPNPYFCFYFSACPVQYIILVVQVTYILLRVSIFFSLVSLRNFLCCRENPHFCFEFSSFPVQCTILLVQITIYFTIRALLFVDFFLLVSF